MGHGPAGRGVCPRPVLGMFLKSGIATLRVQLPPGLAQKGRECWTECSSHRLFPWNKSAQVRTSRAYRTSLTHNRKKFHRPAVAGREAAYSALYRNRSPDPGSRKSLIGRGVVPSVVFSFFFTT